MQANIMKVKSCGEMFSVKSEKADNGQTFQDIVATDIIKVNK